jgi:4-hydroxyproline epimerase
MRSVFKCIDAHTCGNPVRVVTNGHPPLEGADINEKRLHFLREYDWIRTGLMFEPRGHDMMSGAFLYPPHDSRNDCSVLFIETSGCLPMCGHGTIGTVTIAIEEGLIKPKSQGKIRMEAPAGLIEIDYQETKGRVDWVRLTNVPSYLAAERLSVDIHDLGTLTFDVAYGGNFYAIVDPQENFKGLEHFTAEEIIRFSREARYKINSKYPDRFIHPEHNSIRNVSHLLWTGTPIKPSSSGRNAVFYGEKAIDRSPCGTGTSARMAQLYSKGLLPVNKDYIHESFIGSTFTGRVEREVELGGKIAIIPSIKGWAKVYGYNTIIIDEQEDPFAHGFQVV